MYNVAPVDKYPLSVKYHNQYTSLQVISKSKIKYAEIDFQTTIDHNKNTLPP